MEVYRLHPVLVLVLLWTAGIIVALITIAFTVISFLPSPSLQKYYKRFTTRKQS